MVRLEVNCLVKNINRSSEEEKIVRKDVERYLEAVGLPPRVAEEVAERVENSVKDNWTRTRVNEQVDLELKRLEEELQRAASTDREQKL
jgi:hypothetical protein